MQNTDAPTADSPRPRSRSRHRRVGVAAIAIGVAGLVAASVGLASASSPAMSPPKKTAKTHHSTPPPARRKLTTKWVEEGFAQIRVPATWNVVAGLGCSIYPPTPSLLFVGVPPSASTGCQPLPKLGKGDTDGWLFLSRAVGRGKPVAVLDGFDAFAASEDGAAGYLVPGLGVELLWEGARPSLALGSLGWSTLHYVFTDGPAKVPSSWVVHVYDGVSVSAPASWPVYRPLVLKCDSVFDNGPSVGFGIKVIPLPCPYMPPSTTPSDGVVVTPTSQILCPVRATLDIAGGEALVCSDPAGVQPPEIQVRLVMGSGPTATTEYVLVGLGTNPLIAREVLGGLGEVIPVTTAG